MTTLKSVLTAPLTGSFNYDVNGWWDELKQGGKQTHLFSVCSYANEIDGKQARGLSLIVGPVRMSVAMLS